MFAAILSSCSVNTFRQATVICALLAGCSGQNAQDKVASLNDSNIKRVANLYMAYQRVHDWKGPQDEATFKNFIQKEMPAHRLEMMQVDPNDVDGLFRSERDDKPFKIRYGIGGGPGWAVAVVFEESGNGGNRQVALTDGSVEEANEDRYAQLLEDKGH